MPYENIVITVTEIVENISIVVNDDLDPVSIIVNDFSITNVLSNDAGNSASLGSDGKLYVSESTRLPNFIQSVPSDTWVVNHNTGIKRSLEFFTNGGLKIQGDVVILNNNTTIGYFLTPIDGYAILI